MTHDVELTIWEHLAELRNRLLWAAGAVAVGTAVGVVFSTRVLELLLVPLGGHMPQTLHPTESFVVYFRIALILGLVIGMPMIVYQVVRFAMPGLEDAEKKYLYFLLPTATISYACGVAFAIFVMLPAAITFLQGFLSTIIENNWSLDNYVGFVTNVMFWMGIVFEMPLMMYFLTKLGLITPRKLTRFRKYAIVLNAVIAAVVTPTPDPVNMTIVMVPLLLLYEMGVVLSRVAMRGKEAEPAAS